MTLQYFPGEKELTNLITIPANDKRIGMDNFILHDSHWPKISVPSQLSWEQVHVSCKFLAAKIYQKNKERGYGIPIRLWGIPSGGAIVASLICAYAHEQIVQVENPEDATAIVDDIYDSGETLQPWISVLPCYVLVNKGPECPAVLVPASYTDSKEEFVQLPWENSVQRGERLVTRMLQMIGEDPSREGLIETPARVVRSWNELYGGYKVDPVKLLKTFEAPSDEMVVVRNILFASACEHHLLPFHGSVDVGYLPNKRIVGLSKIPRLVDAFAKRLQVQERMTSEIANTLNHALQPHGVGVVVRGYHLCSSIRGVGKPGTEMVTQSLLGLFRDEPDVRSEFLQLTHRS